MPTLRSESLPNATGPLPVALLRRKTAKRTITIRSRADIDRLLASARRFRALGGPRLVLAVPGLSPDRRQHLESQLNTAWNACGCGEGAIAATFAVAVVGVGSLHGVEIYSTGVLLRTTLLMVIALFSGGLLGKLAGLALANLRLRRVVGELSKHCSSSGGPGPFEEEV